jgi:hypothetical protein
MPATDTTVPTTTWRQIPIGVKMSLGARDPLADKNTLTFRAGPSRKTYKFSIALNGNDTYEIKLVLIKRGSYEVVLLAEAEDVYNDSLGRVLLSMEKHLT